MENRTLGTFIAFLRKEKHLTQKQLAELLNVSDKTVSHWECDETSPDISLLPLLAQTLGVTVDELLKGEKAPPQPTVEHHYIPPKSESVFDKAGNFASRTFNKIKNNMSGDISERYRYFRMLSLIGTVIGCVVLLSVALSMAFSAYYMHPSIPVGLIALFGSLWTIVLSLGFTLGARFLFTKELIPSDETDKTEKEYISKANKICYNNVFLVFCAFPLALASIDILPVFVNLIITVAFIAAARLVSTVLLAKKGFLAKNDRNTLLIKYICICLVSVFAVCGSVLFFTEEIYYPTPENIIFDNASDFKAYMETPADKPENAYILDGVEASTYPPTMPAPGHTSSTESPVQTIPSGDEEVIGETVMGYCDEDYVTFRWLNKAVYDFAYNDEEGTFHVITYEAKIKAENQSDFIDDTLPVLLVMFCVADVVTCFALYKRKTNRLKNKA